MNSVLRIQVRVNSGPATAEIKAIQAALLQMSKAVTAATAAMNKASARAAGAYGAMNRAGTGAGAAMNRFGSSISSAHLRLEKFGKNVQWSGRQIEYNFTLPILLAGAAAFKFALDQEKAFTRVKKVYGDQIGMTQALMEANSGLTEDMASQQATAIFASELGALTESFRALSDRYGVARAEVNAIAADWAAAGASGVALARGVQASLDAMILGEMDAKEATEALIAVQAQYGLNSEQLVETLGILNAVENATGASLSGLVQGFARSASAARTAGVGVRELAAFISALTPATGSATNAGNALKTIFSRILAPTAEAARVMGLMGINVKEAGWQSKTATERLLEMADKFQNLSNAQQAVVSATVASRYQISRFDQLMRSLVNTNSYYYAALKATSDQTQVLKQYQKELNAVLESNPRKFEIIKTRIQNLLADAIIPLLPAILGVMNKFAELLKSFTNLDPAIQQLIIGGLLLTAAFGTVLRLVGAAAIFIGYLGGVFLKTARLVLLLPVALGMAAKAVYTIVYGVIARALTAVAGMFASLTVTALSTTLAWTAATLRTIATWAAGVIGQMAVATLSMLRAWATFAAYFMATGVAMFTNMLRVTAAWGLAMTGIFFRTLVTGMARGWLAIIGLSGRGLLGLARLVGPGLLAIFTGPWGIAIGAALLLMVAFRDQIGTIVSQTIERMKQFIPAVAAIFRGVAQVLGAAIGKIRELLSYLNPFQRHSPSLVDNVTAGVAVIAKKYASLKSIASSYGSLIAATKEFTAATQAARSAIQAQERAEQRLVVVQAAGAAAGRSFDALVASIKRAEAELVKLEAQMEAQQRVVDAAEAAYKALDDRLDAATKKLNSLQDAAQAAADAIAASQQKIDDFANAPLAGLDALEDEIWANTVAQKELQLAMMGIEDSMGPIDDVRNRLALMQGEVENLRGTQEDLRQSGAGSDILDMYDDEIKAIGQQQNAVADQISSYSDLQSQLDELGREAERLDLEKFLDFETLQHQIEELVDTRKELTFDEIVSGITSERANLVALTAAYDQAQAALRDQQAVVDALTAARDAARAQYDMEQAKLTELKSAYDEIAQSIADATSMLNDFVSTSKQAAAAKLSPAEQNFTDAASGNWEDPGGTAGIGRDSFTDETAAIDEFTQGILDDIETQFAGMDIFAPFKDAWNKAIAWIKQNIPVGVSDFVNNLKANIGQALLGAGIGAMIGGIIGGPVGAVIGSLIGGAVGSMIPTDRLQAIGDTLSGWLESIKGMLQNAWNAISGAAKIAWSIIGGPIIEFGKLIWGFITGLVDKVKEKFSTWGDIVEPVKGAFTNIMKVIGIALGAVLLVWKATWPVLRNVLKPIFDAIIAIVGGAIDVIHGIILFVSGILSGDWAAAWEGVKNIFGGIWDAIVGILKGIPGIIWGIITGLVEGVFDLFHWLWDELVGHSIIPDMVNAIIDWFKKLPGVLLGLVVNLVKSLIQFFGELPGKIWSALQTLGGFLWDVATKAFAFFLTALQTAWPIVWTWITGIPQLIWNGLQALGGLLWDVATKAFEFWLTAFTTAWGTIWTWITERPQAIWDGLIGIKDKLGDVASKAWNWFITKQAEGWTKIWTWIKERPQAIWDGLIAIKDKIGDVASKAWNWFITKQVEGWSKIWTWIKERPQAIWDGLIGIKDKIGEVARTAFEWFKTKASEKWTSIIEWVKGRPQAIADGFSGIKDKIATKVAGMWDGIKDAFRNALNWVIDKWNNFRISVGGWKIDTIFGSFEIPKVEFGMPQIPRFAKGGITNGPSLVGEGRKRYPEFVIPTDPAYRRNSLRLLTQATQALGAQSGSRMALDAAIRSQGEGVQYVRSSVSAPTEYHFNGDLSFPNIKNGDDAKEFIENLRAIAGGGEGAAA